VAQIIEDLEWRARQTVADTFRKYQAVGSAEACTWEAIETALEIEFGAAFQGDLPSDVLKFAREAFLNIHLLWH